MKNFSKKAFSVLLTGTLILGSVPGPALAGSINSMVQAGTGSSEYTYSQRQSPERKQAIEQTVEEMQEVNKPECKEGEALVLYYGTNAQLRNSNAIQLGSSIKVDQTWDFGIVADKNEVATKGLDASYSNEIIMKVCSDTLSTKQLIIKLKTNPNVKTAEPNYICKAADLGTNDTYNPYQWSLENIGQNGGTAGDDINVDAVWNTGTKGTEKVIAIIDTGVDYNHEELKDNIWTNENTGILSGIHGYDFANYDDDPLDDNGHGTHCSGIMTGDANDTGITGVNQSAKIMALKFLDSSGGGMISGAIDAYNYIYRAQTKLGVDVVAINNSWGGYGEDNTFTIMKKVIDKVGQEGALSICAAGNSSMDNDKNSFYVPCCVDSDYIISVAASNENDGLAVFSSYGKKTVELAAPGADILSSVVVNTFNPSIYKDKYAYCDYYNDFSDANTVSDYVLKNGETKLEDTKGMLEIDTNTYFGADNGDSLKLNLSGVKDSDNYQLIIPYTATESSKAIYDSAMIKVASTSGGAIFVDMYDVNLDEDGNPTNGLSIGGTATDAVNNYWDHAYGKAMETSKAGESRAIVFVFFAYQEGNYQINIDDLAVSKANLDSSSFGKYDFYNGTSMATPHVTGAVALTASYFDNKNEDLSVLNLRDQVVSCVRQVPSMNDKVSSGGVLDLSRINQPVPIMKGVAVNTDRNIELKGNFFGTTGNLKINSTAISADQFTCENSVITILDRNLNESIINTKADFEFTTPIGTAKGSYYIVGASKTAALVDTFENVDAYGNVISDGTTFYFLDSANCLFKYGIADVPEVKTDSVIEGNSDVDVSQPEEPTLIPLSPMVSAELFPNEIVDETNPMQLVVQTQLVYSNGKIWTVVANSTPYSKDFALVSYNVVENKWVNESELPMEVISKNNYFTLAAYDGKLYCIGGLNMSEHTASTEVQMFDPDTKQWSQKADLPEGRFYSIAKQVGDKLVVTLGGNDSGNCPKNLVFDGTSWTQQTAVLSPILSQSMYYPDKNGTIPVEDFYGNIQYYKEVKYYTAEVGLVNGGLIYAGLPSNGAGIIYTYDLASDKYLATDYKLTEDSSKTGFLATSVGNVLYAMYTIYTGETYAANLVSMPIQPGFINVSCSCENGTVTGAGYYLPGETITLKVTPDSGFCVLGFMVKEGSESEFVSASGNEYSFKLMGDTEVSVVFGTYVSGIKLSATNVVLEAGKTLNLTATITPESATDKSLSWDSSDSSLASVDENGKVTALEAGVGKTVTIIATAKDGSGVNAECKFTIIKKVSAITIQGQSTKLKVGKSMVLKAVITPTNATNKEVTWTSSNTKYATVDANGNVTAKLLGAGKTVTITATAKDGSNVKATYNIKIKLV